MLTRTKFIALLAAAAGGPYVATETEFGRNATSSVSSMVSTESAESWSDIGRQITGDTKYASHSHYEVETLRDTQPQRFRYETVLAKKLGAIPDAPNAEQTLVGVQVPDLREVLRFDITDRWLLGRFSRVSTVLADLRMEGLRVPIVTGTHATDLAGTLTYYFDHSGKLQRIQLHGFTGDPNRLVQLMTQFYGLAPEPAIEAGVYTKRWNGLPVQFLRLTHAPVVYSDAVHQKFTVFIELNQPNLAYGISDEAKSIISSDRSTGRW